MAAITATVDRARVGIVARLDEQSDQASELMVKLRRKAGHDTAEDIAPPSWLYFDCGTRTPDAERVAQREEIVFAYLDFEPSESVSLVIELDSGPVSGTYTVNDWAAGSSGSIRAPLVIATKDLQRWENTVHLKGSGIGVTDVYFRVEIPAGTRETTIDLQPLHRPWEATVELCRAAEVLASKTVSHPGPPDTAGVGTGVATGETAGGGAAAAGTDTASGGPANAGDNARAPATGDRLSTVERLRAVVSAVMAGRVTDSRSPFFGGFHLVYDQTRSSYRAPHWIWAWGPTMRLLLEAAPLLETEAADELVQAADRAGKTSLGFFIDDPRHMAADISTVRWYAALGTPGGSIRYASLADSLFLAGWGWMPLHEATGNPDYREASERLVRKAQRLLSTYDVPPQDYVFECSTWTPHTLDESGFGMVGFEGLHNSTGEKWVRDVGKLFIDRHLDVFLNDGPMWHRIYMRDEQRPFGGPDVKGHAWIVDCYLSAYGLTGEQRYLDLAGELAERTMACQHEDGSWTVGYHVPEEGESRDDKAAGIWAYQMRRLYSLTGDSRHLNSSRKAIAWCDRQLSVDPAVQGFGSMVNPKPMAHIKTRDLAVLYSTTYYGLALVEEIKAARKEP